MPDETRLTMCVPGVRPVGHVTGPPARMRSCEDLRGAVGRAGRQGGAGHPRLRHGRAARQGVHAIGKKVVEEAAEAWMAAEHEDAERTAEEIAQLLYHAQVLMLAKGLDLKDVYRHL